MVLPLLTFIAFLVGSSANAFINQDDWYLSLNKSELNPPGYVFGIVWPILYTLMGFVSYFNSKLIYK
ncbi:MAG: TspO/MBR family protein, partial [Candidatus Neomarinimicrobiota bacterium]